MELGVRDWMIIVGVLLILVVLLDGYRRVRNERRGKIRIALNKQFINSGDLDEDPGSHEFPNGGARTVGRSKVVSSQRQEPVLGNIDGLDLDQSVPLLMESVVSANMAGELANLEEDEPVARDLFSEELDSAATKTTADKITATTKSAAAVGTDFGKSAAKSSGVKKHPPKDKAIATHDSDEASADTAESAAKSAPPYTGVQEVLVINVVAKDEPFAGPDLLHILLACDLRHGKMDIFHRHEQANGRGQVQFSVANSVEPGTFDLSSINTFTTPGVCFFMSVPGPEDSGQAFECMVETAQCLVKNLSGDLLDESRSAMTAQTLEHCRQRLREFERRQLAQA